MSIQHSGGPIIAVKWWSGCYVMSAVSFSQDPPEPIITSMSVHRLMGSYCFPMSYEPIRRLNSLIHCCSDLVFWWRIKEEVSVHSDCNTWRHLSSWYDHGDRDRNPIGLKHPIFGEGISAHKWWDDEWSRDGANVGSDRIPTKYTDNFLVKSRWFGIFKSFNATYFRNKCPKSEYLGIRRRDWASGQ